jgi:hypothetical protein
MDKFLDAHGLPKLNHEYINHISKYIMSNEREAVRKNLPQRKAQDYKDSLLNFTRSLKKN